MAEVPPKTQKRLKTTPSSEPKDRHGQEHTIANYALTAMLVGVKRAQGREVRERAMNKNSVMM